MHKSWKQIQPIFGPINTRTKKQQLLVATNIHTNLIYLTNVGSQQSTEHYHSHRYAGALPVMGKLECDQVEVVGRVGKPT